MLLFAGLGNPGGQYARNRHNIGFMVVDRIWKDYAATPFRSRFGGLVAEGTVGGERILLLKPSTFMNESGRSVSEAARFHKVDLGHIVVFHDELDLVPGKLRVKTGGGNAGHNGLRSISAHLGNDYRRVRLGIGHPGDRSLVHRYVLSDFGQDERGWVDALCGSVADNAGLLAKGENARFQNKVRLAMDAAGFDESEGVGPP